MPLTQPRPLTARQRELLTYLRSYRRAHKRMPTHLEIAGRLGVTESAVRDVLDALERKAVLARLPGVPRGLRLLTRSPAADAAPCRGCSERAGTYRLGLCRTCYHTAAVRAKYVAGPDGGLTGRPVTPCRHCGRMKVVRRFGLCWSCCNVPEVRGLYAPAARPTGLFVCGAPPPPDSPTDAAPGSEAKKEIMRARAESGRAVFHPLDFGAPRHGWCDPARDGAA